jgi:hypothetical protein
MILFMHGSQILPINVGIDLCRRDIGVAEHFLNGAQIGAALE